MFCLHIPTVRFRLVIAQAMNEISSASCITFKAKTTEKKGFIGSRKKDDGCYVNRLGYHKNKKMKMNLDPEGCIVGHFLLDALHIRQERDLYPFSNSFSFPKS